VKAVRNDGGLCPKFVSPGFAGIHDRKLELLEELIEEANGQNVLVAYWFQHDRNRIRQRFPEARELKTDQDIADWNAGKIQLALISPASAGHGLNIQQGGHILIWFSLIWSLEMYQQTNARLWRQGQKETVTIHHLLTADTIDGDMLAVLKNKDKTQAGAASFWRPSGTRLAVASSQNRCYIVSVKMSPVSAAGFCFFKKACFRMSENLLSEGRVGMNHYILQPGDGAEKPTAEAAARDALTTLRGLAEDAADRMKEILDNAEIPDGMKIAVINMVLERVYGRPEEMLRIESGERNVEEAEARLRRIGAI